MSLISKIKNTRLYEIYHFHAKYLKTRNDSKIDISEGVSCEALYSDNAVHFFGYYDSPVFLTERSCHTGLISTVLIMGRKRISW